MNRLSKQIILAELQNTNGWIFKGKYTRNNTTERLNPNMLKNIKNITKLQESEANQMVYAVDNKYVIKLTYFTTDASVESFAKEIRVGWIPNAKTFGVNIHAYKASQFMKKKYGIYIMDHVTFGNNNLKALTLHQYLMKVNNGNINEFVNNTFQFPIIERVLHKRLMSFYKHTKGFHGDLHKRNIIILLTKNNTIADVKIIDYGNFVPFDSISKYLLNSLNSSSKKVKYLNIVQSAFNRFKTQHKISYMPHNRARRTPIKYTNSGLPFRSNRAMLNEMNMI